MNGTCEQCTFGFFMEGDSCESCSQIFEGCNTCDGSKCLQCQEGFVQTDGVCTLPCIDVEHCSSCSLTNNLECSKCQGNLRLVNGECTCPTNTFLEITSGKASCKTCDNAVENCLKCSSDFESCQACASGFYIDENQLCTSNSCRLLDSIGNCVKCNEKPVAQLLTQSNQCVFKCSEGYTLSSGKCESICSS